MTTALEVFREVGFDAASMSLIAARIGGSKATLYNYFSSKEELLLAAMRYSAQELGQNIMTFIGSPGDLRRQLERFAQSLLAVLNDENTLRLIRVAISVSGQSEHIGKHFFDLGTEAVWQKMADFMARQVAAGKLKPENPEVLAMHLRCLCDMDLMCNLMRAHKLSTQKEIGEKAKLIADLFLRTHGASSS
ncbi:TetR/AcrR family transcriptional regulator [Neopusillimonas aromaticivorans]|uniref:TetR/AcrR family transcriptional regulator n=1 Tax=Neopusillimonas aromaticivorans TaxID=2979868 RepID=UPI0025984E25|nr:TetR/AcrR family transcriptional regulator [Neopusillimonas aromaticivorans]WJJ93660.1 TetR/AcrR family transcriptional regulator [Neopusillimonas aromaticivorans]